MFVVLSAFGGTRPPPPGDRRLAFVSECWDHSLCDFCCGDRRCNSPIRLYIVPLLVWFDILAYFLRIVGWLPHGLSCASLIFLKSKHPEKFVTCGAVLDMSPCRVSRSRMDLSGVRHYHRRLGRVFGFTVRRRLDLRCDPASFRTPNV